MLTDLIGGLLVLAGGLVGGIVAGLGGLIVALPLPI